MSFSGNVLKNALKSVQEDAFRFKNQEEIEFEMLTRPSLPSLAQSTTDLLHQREMALSHSSKFQGIKQYDIKHYNVRNQMIKMYRKYFALW